MARDQLLPDFVGKVAGDGEAKAAIQAVDQSVHPITLPSMSQSGPPLFPGLIDASVCK